MNNDLKLFKVYRVYGKAAFLDVLWAKDKEGVYTLMNWDKRDMPELIIEEIPPVEGCFISQYIEGILLTKTKGD